MIPEKELEKLKRLVEEYIKGLTSMQIGDIKEIVVDDFTIHKLKRVSQYEWEYICDCCNGRRLAMLNDNLTDTGVNESMCHICKKWYGCNCNKLKL